MKRKGQVSGILLTLLPFIVPVVVAVVGATIISVLKLPLVLLTSVVIFFFTVPFVRDKLDVRKKYSIAGAGLLAAFSFFVLLQVNFFIVAFLVLLVVVLNVSVDTFMDISPFDAGLELLREEKNEGKTEINI